MSNPARILIVVNSLCMVSLLERMLLQKGFRVPGVTTVQEAHDFLAKHATDWVITDVMLPTGDGMDILAYARAQQPVARVIVMTAFGSEATRRQVMGLGAHGFLSKSFHSQVLLAFLGVKALPDGHA
jgi:two-component system, NtrC family, response regulator PilR